MTPTTLESIQAASADAENRLNELQIRKEAALQKVRDQFHDKVRAARDDAAAAQHAAADAEAVSALLDREDGAIVAENLGLAHMATTLGLDLPDPRTDPGDGGDANLSAEG